jgi:glycosidase
MPMHKLLLYTILSFSLCLTQAVKAQVVTLTPSFPTQNDNVTITFDATKGNAALTGETTVYAHTGVITDQSSTPTSWKYVQGTWGADDSRVKMTSIGNNKFQITFNIKTYYGIPNNEQVLKLAFVFRNKDGSKVGRNSDGSDIFAEISDGGFRLSLSINPSGTPPILALTDTLHLNAASSSGSPLSLYINDSLYASSATDTTLLSYSIPAATLGYGKHKIVTRAVFNSAAYADSAYIIIRPATASNVGLTPAYVKDGINYINDSTVALQLFAPAKNYVYVTGDFNNWQLDPAYEMTKTPDGNRYWLIITGLLPGVEYSFQYSINKEQLRVADPFADKLLDQQNDPYINTETYPGLKAYPAGQTTNYVSVLQTAQTPYSWQYSFIKPASDNLVIYELLIRDFIGKHNYQTLTDTLDYLQRLGINAIELMPFNEFEGNESWGYNTVFYFAPDKYYGTKQALKAFIDECHRRGIAVIMDMVLNHSFGQSSMVRMYFDNTTGKPLNSPWFNADATHPYNVGYDFNHESIYTQNFVDTVLRYWINEYHIDGYRFDLSKGFTQTYNPTNVGAWSAYDQSRINIWKRIADKFRPACSDCYMILEHLGDNSEEKVLSDYGFMLWGNMNYAFNEATMGYNSDLSSTSYKQRGWNNPNLVSYMESHDEERIQYKNINFGSTSPAYNVKDTIIGLSRNEAAAAILASLPGPYMIWQFGELGYDYSIDYNGRIGNKPIRWDYLEMPARKRLYDVYAALNKLRTTEPAFRTRDFSYNLSQSFKTIRLNDSSMNVIVAANFGTTAQKAAMQVAGSNWWYEYFSGDSILLAPAADTITLKAGGYAIFTTKRLITPEVTPVTGLYEHIAEDATTLFPNPAQHYITVSNNIKIRSYRIYDLGGRKIADGIPSAGNTINVSSLSPGYYLIELSTMNNNTLIRKLLINK